MNRRKAYIEQMTAYLNDRIRELNKVKSELAEEVKWITVSQNRIQELAEREKLVKYQDILSCLNTDNKRTTGETTLKAASVARMQAQTQSLTDKIKNIQTVIADTQKGTLVNGVAAGA